MLKSGGLIQVQTAIASRDLPTWLRRNAEPHDLKTKKKGERQYFINITN